MVLSNVLLAVIAGICLGNYAVLSQPGTVDLVRNMAVSGITKNSAVLKWGLDSSLLFMDVGLTFVVSLKEATKTTCKQIVTFDQQITLTGLKPGTNYQVTVAPHCEGSAFHHPQPPPKFQTSDNQNCKPETSCYISSKPSRFRTMTK